MADLSITASQVAPVVGSSRMNMGTAGEAITAGESVYRKSDGLIYLADASAEATAAAKGIATTSSAISAGVEYCFDGTITVGADAAPTAGAVYVVSATAGGIAVESDIASGEYVTIIGVGTTNDRIVVGITVSGVAHA